MTSPIPGPAGGEATGRIAASPKEMTQMASHQDDEGLPVQTVGELVSALALLDGSLRLAGSFDRGYGWADTIKIASAADEDGACVVIALD